MKRELLAELYQLNCISYLSPIDHYFRVFRATDFLKGEIIRANTVPTGLQDLVSPCSVEEFKNTFTKAGRSDIFDSKFLEMKPCGKKIYSTKEFVGVVKSMSCGGEASRQKIGIIHAGDPLRVNHTCKCDKKSDNWFVRSVWHRIILDEWKIPEYHVKYYQFSTCPHICAGDFYIRANFGSRIFGIKDGFDTEEKEDGKIKLRPFLKPYILAFKEALDCAPTFPDYIFDTILTHHTGFFNGIKKYIDSMRKVQGMKALDLHGIGDYLVENFVHSGYSEDKINELLWVFAGL
jgi:hypothetical protein